MPFYFVAEALDASNVLFGTGSEDESTLPMAIPLDVDYSLQFQIPDSIPNDKTGDFISGRIADLASVNSDFVVLIRVSDERVATIWAVPKAIAPLRVVP
jgi:hypothetical protein